MKKFIVGATFGAMIALSSPADLSAQPWQAGLQGDDAVSLALRLGAVAPSTTLPDDAEFSGGLGGGASLTYWAHPNIGLRANYEMGKTEGNDILTSRPSQEDPTVSFFGGELDFRYPIIGGSMGLAPYIGAGAGMKQYDWSEDSTGIDRDLVFAWNLTGGLDIRPVSSPWVGVVLEAKRYSSKYKFHQYALDQQSFNDLLFTIGISLNR